MKAKELIKILQDIEDQETEIDIAQSQYDWESVLYYIPDPANADYAEEIRL